jgi:hypothetical protein
LRRKAAAPERAPLARKPDGAGRPLPIAQARHFGKSEAPTIGGNPLTCKLVTLRQ